MSRRRSFHSGRVGSGGSNIEEGYGQLSRAEYIRFLDIARGSARETRGRYERMKHWLNQEIIRQRLELLDQIIGILTNSIVNRTIKERGLEMIRSSLDTRPSPLTSLGEKERS